MRSSSESQMSSSSDRDGLLEHDRPVVDLFVHQVHRDAGDLRSPSQGVLRRACAPGKAGSRAGWTFSTRSGKTWKNDGPSTRMKPASTTRVDVPRQQLVADRGRVRVAIGERTELERPPSATPAAAARSSALTPGRSESTTTTWGAIDGSSRSDLEVRPRAGHEHREPSVHGRRHATTLFIRPGQSAYPCAAASRGSARCPESGMAPTERTEREDVPLLRGGDPGRGDQVPVLPQRPHGPAPHGFLVAERHAGDADASSTSPGTQGPTGEASAGEASAGDDAEAGAQAPVSDPVTTSSVATGTTPAPASSPAPRRHRRPPAASRRPRRPPRRPSTKARSATRTRATATSWGTGPTSSASGIGRRRRRPRSASRARTRDGGRRGPDSHRSSRRHMPVPDAGGTAPSPAAPQPGMVPPDSSDTEALQYTHSGSRYLLGYGRTFFGIWDRQAPGGARGEVPARRHRMGGRVAALHADRAALRGGRHRLVASRRAPAPAASDARIRPPPRSVRPAPIRSPAR